MTWLGLLLVWQLSAFLWSRWERRAVARAVALRADAEGRRVIWVGAPRSMHRLPAGFVVVDLDPHAGADVVGDVRQWGPWSDAARMARIRASKGSASPLVVISHVLEHVSEPQKVLAHARSVSPAPHGVTVLWPRWWWLGAWLVPGHRWIMGWSSGRGWWFRRNPLCWRGADRPGTWGLR